MKNLLSAGSIGIIGGSDGPTAIFVTYPDDWWKYAVTAAIILITFIALIIRKKRKK